MLVSDIDLIIVNTPIGTHYEYTRQLLLAGKHAVVEKSFTRTAVEAEQLKARAEERGELAVFQNRR